MTESPDLMPEAPEVLSGDHVKLRFDVIRPGDESKGHVPFYHFRIVNDDGTDVGHINLRIGDTDHVTFRAGHVGYEITPAYRGRGYAFHACKALASFIRSLRSEVLLTVDPLNLSSIRTIEKLGCTFLDEIAINPAEDAYKRGERLKRRYLWRLWC